MIIALGFIIWLRPKDPGREVAAENSAENGRNINGGFLSHRGTPSHHPNFSGIFPKKNQPFWGTPHSRKPPNKKNGRQSDNEEPKLFKIRNRERHLRIGIYTGRIVKHGIQTQTPEI